MSSFSNFPDEAQIWIFQAKEDITEDMQKAVAAVLNPFIESWNSHGVDVKGAYQVIYKRFLVVSAADEASGCSKDTLFRAVKEINQKTGNDFLDYSLVAYREDDVLNFVSKDEFENLVKQNVVTQETTVFNNNIISLKEFREGKWECAFKDSWHQSRFG